MKYKYLPNIVFAIISMACLYLVARFSLVEAPNIALITLWAGLLVIFTILSYPSGIESISFFGNSIKLRKVAEEINKLKLLAEGNTKALFELMQTQMRFGGVPDEERQTHFNQLTNTLKEIGFNSDEITEIQSRWHYWIEGDYIREMLGSNIYGSHLVNTEKKEEWRNKRDDFYSKINVLTPNELREIFQEFCDEDKYKVVEIIIDDFEFYKKNKKHRDFERWKNRDNWFKG